MERLENDAKLAVEWFEHNYMKLNEYKCHPLLAGHRYKALWTNFDDHVFVLCKKVCRKLTALSRISNYMSFEKITEFF